MNLEFRPRRALMGLARLTLSAALVAPVAGAVQERAPRFPQPPADFADRDHTNRMVNELIRMAHAIQDQTQRGQKPSSAAYLEYSRARTKVNYYMAFAKLEVELRKQQGATARMRDDLEQARQRNDLGRVRMLESAVASAEEAARERRAALAGEASPFAPRELEYRPQRYYGEEQHGWREVSNKELGKYLPPVDVPHLSPFWSLRLCAHPVSPLHASIIGTPHIRVPGDYHTLARCSIELDSAQRQLPTDELGLTFAREIGEVRRLVAEGRDDEAAAIWDRKWSWIMAWEPSLGAADPVDATAAEDARAASVTALRLQLPRGADAQALCAKLKAFYKIAAKPKSGLGKVEARRREQLFAFARTLQPHWKSDAETVLFTDLTASRAGGPFHILFADVRGGLEAELVARTAPDAAKKLEQWIKNTKVRNGATTAGEHVLRGLRRVPALVRDKDYAALAAVLSEGRQWFLEGSGLRDAQ